MSAVATAAGLVSFPVGAGIAGAALAAWRKPGPRLTSAVQHFAAGVVLAAVAGEVLPDLRSEGRLGAVVVGFATGVALLLALGAWSRRREAAATSGTAASSAHLGAAGTSALPLGMLVAVGIDLLIDGTLVGLGATLGSRQGLILTVALTLEILFLAVSVCIELLEAGVARTRAAVICAALGLATAVGAIGSALLLGDASKTVLAAVLAFGAAALLYLVVEELLVEAHEQSETALLGAMFFAGFLGLYILAELGG
ncbi:ZIP family metal transporter [Calidifontibacter sp. DB0510]|uniref:ZIP family metal transporter n=1 Tax=Metallococcus carri TaxID=1656884 RepID=A0A967EH19_9MICO|nr:ZIP family metal transporter [Metallococcus carri]NHN55818.1 ZIP family metal transporter [Metallococcus carri]NOP38494.1 ZIP family metal transporter [Calidifontibacter sp. DB2511S]